MDVQGIREKGRDTAPPIEREKLLASLVSIALGFLKGYNRGSFTSWSDLGTYIQRWPIDSHRSSCLYLNVVQIGQEEELRSLLTSFPQNLLRLLLFHHHPCEQKPLRIEESATKAADSI